MKPLAFVSQRRARTMALCVGASACEGRRPEEGRVRQWARALGSPRLLLDLIQKSPLSAAARGGKQTARIVENAESSSWRNSTAWQCSEPGSARQQLPQRAGRPWHPEPVPGPGGRDTDTPVSADKASRVLTLNAESFPCPRDWWGRWERGGWR